MNASIRRRAAASLLCLAGIAALVSLSGCRQQDASNETATPPPAPQASAAAGSATTPAGPAPVEATAGQAADPAPMHADSGEPPGGGHVIQQHCGSAEFALSIDAGGDENAMRTTLRRLDPAAGTKTIAVPDALKDYVAVGLGCATSPVDGRAYLVVQYGQLPEGCAFCEWFHLYDTDGNVLTRNAQALLIDQSQPPGKQQYPDNESYDAMLKKLRIAPPEIQYVE